jgi:hypothetical protein
MRRRNEEIYALYKRVQKLEKAVIMADQIIRTPAPRTLGQQDYEKWYVDWCQARDEAMK